MDVRREHISGATDNAFVSAIGRDLTVLSMVSDNCAFDGVWIVRTEDITYLRWGTEYLQAKARVLEGSPSSPEPVGYVDISDWGSAIRSVTERHPVLTLHRERTNDDVCDVAAEVEVLESVVIGESISIRGTRDGRFSIELDDITRLDFAGGYERGYWQRLRAD